MNKITFTSKDKDTPTQINDKELYNMYLKLKQRFEYGDKK